MTPHRRFMKIPPRALKMKYYLTWGIGHGSKLLAEKNALRRAKILNVNLKGLEKLEIPKANFIELKKEITGQIKGIILKRCAKGASAVALAFGVTAGKIYVGKGRAGSLQKAIKKAEFELKKFNKKFESTQQIAASAEAQKGKYSCAVVALLIK